MAQVRSTGQPQDKTQDAVCEDCVMPGVSQESLVQHADGTATLMCVKCPFCKEIVNAHMTKTSISCPACQVTVRY